MSKRGDMAEGDDKLTTDEARAADPTETSESVTGEPSPDEAVEGRKDKATETPAVLDVGTFEATVIDPPAEVDDEQEVEKQDTQPEVPKGHELVRYTGPADSFEHGAYVFRGGEPVAVPSDIAEELLTYPYEPFERVERA